MLKRFLFLLTFGFFSHIYAQEVAVLKYNGGGDWYSNPTALPNLINFTNENSNTKISKDPTSVAVGNTDLFSFPIVFMTGHGNVFFSDDEAQNLRNYLISGGFLHISDNYGLDKYIRREMKKVFPKLSFQEIPKDHPIYNQTFSFKDGLPKIHEHDKNPPQGFGIFYEGRLVCFYDFETDLSDGWEDASIHNNPEEVRLKALRMGANIIEYAFKKTDPNLNIDSIRINFDTESLWILNIAIAIIMFGVALGITMEDFKRLIRNPKILLVGVFSQFILLPALTFVAIIIIKPHPSFALGMMMIAACPGGNVSNFFSKMAKGNAALSVSLTAFATLVCLFMTPFNLQFWGGLYEPTNAILQSVELSPLDMFKLVLLILGIPLVAGMIVNHKFPNASKKIERILKPFSMIVFIALILIAFYENIDIFLDYIYLVAALVIFHNIGAFIIGFYTAKAFGLEKKDVKTISMETGIQNGGLGLLLIFGFFEGLGGMALLAAFWGIWDVFSGMLLATYWGRRDKSEVRS